MARCYEKYQGNSFIHLRDTPCIKDAHPMTERHLGPNGVIAWFTKPADEIKKEASDDMYRAPEVCRFLGLKDIDTQHYIANLMNEQFDRQSKLNKK